MVQYPMTRLLWPDWVNSSPQAHRVQPGIQGCKPNGASAWGEIEPPADLRSPCGVAFFETASFEVQGLPFCKREGSLLQKSKDSSPAFRRHYRPARRDDREPNGRSRSWRRSSRL